MDQGKDKVEKIIFAAIDDYNDFHPEEQKLEKNTGTVLFSRAGFTKSGKLDSIGLVNLLVLIEEKMKTVFGNAFMLDIQQLIQEKEKYLKDLGTLLDYLEIMSRKIENNT